MELLLHHSALARVAGKLELISPALTPVILCDDGNLRRDDTIVSFADVAPTAIWLSVDILLSPELPKIRDIALHQATVQWVQIGSAGVNDPLYKKLHDRGVKLSGSVAQAVAVAEYVIGSVFGAWYPRERYAAGQQGRKWQRVLFQEIYGTNWLIIGYGNIGQRIAERIRPFGVQVTAVRRKCAPNEPHCRMATPTDLPDLLPVADVVVLANALTREAINMANEAFFAQMKQGSYFVNVGRGQSVDEAALLRSLDEGRVACAILDVFREEPLPSDSPLWSHPKVRLTPHTAGAGTGMRDRADQQFLANLERFQTGEQLIAEVSAESF